jgi:hypothetical protein
MAGPEAAQLPYFLVQATVYRVKATEAVRQPALECRDLLEEVAAQVVLVVQVLL